MPEPGGSDGRWVVVLDRALARRYTAAVATVTGRIEASLGPEVVANRAAAADPTLPQLALEPWVPARRRFAARARLLAKRSGALVTTDVRACYASIRSDVVERTLASLQCTTGSIRAVRQVLLTLHAEGVAGLPIGPEPSAVLANAVLAAADRALARAGAAHLRWVDDFWIFASDGHAAGVALESLRHCLGRLGLELAPEKTRLLEGSEVPVACAGSPPLSGPGPRYHRPSDAHPVPGVPGPNAVPPPDGGVGPRRRSARRTGGVR
ncbi:MAG TPA: reverse transcriptase domain-containing protein [Actinomycetota bacterium]